jgi:POT family proton-dependent oligopeptide transporter
MGANRGWSGAGGSGRIAADLMKSTVYLTAPLKSERMPPGIPYIVGNEGAERFSYYGMRSILVIFMTQYLLNHEGQSDVLTEEQAKYWYHLFIGAVYFFPLFGAILAEAFLGKYRTILSLSIVYCLGHLALAIDNTRLGLAVGLTLIAMGSGGIKPCVAANVGDQFGASNRHLIPKVFGWFYFAINFGSTISTLLIPWLLSRFGAHVAFGTPGLLMFLATWIFWLGRREFVHIPPGGMGFVRETFSLEGLRSVAKLAVIYLFVAVFWSLYDQTSSAWVLQARSMDRRFFGIELLPAQIHAMNPILILIMIPGFTYAVYPGINRVFPLTPLRKISIGFFLTAISFLIPAWIEAEIAAGLRPNIGWQLLAYVVITAAEVFVSITCLEFSYTQAPKRMKSLIMSIYNLSVFVGNLFTSLVNNLIQNPDGTVRLAGVDYYLFFAGVMFAAAVLFIFVAYHYKEKTYIQDEVSRD